nr:MAG TPA: hypothetical protein [Caudoviricetes sp.]
MEHYRPECAGLRLAGRQCRPLAGAPRPHGRNAGTPHVRGGIERRQNGG